METEFFLLKLDDIKKKVNQTLRLTDDLVTRAELMGVIAEINGTIKALKGE